MQEKEVIETVSKDRPPLLPLIEQILEETVDDESARDT